MSKIKKTKSPYGTLKYATIDEYHASFPHEIEKKLQQLRKAIKQVAPNAKETISYNIPTFKQNKNLVHYAAYKSHIGFYPTSKPLLVFKEDLATYKTSKGAIQFPIKAPLPLSLIKKIVKFRVLEDSIHSLSKNIKTKKFIQYHKDGSVWAKGKMRGEEMHDYWEWFRKDGVIMRSGYFNNGKQVGEWITYDKQGKIYKVTNMKL